MEDFNEHHARLFYRLLGHKNETEIRGLLPGYPPIIRVVRNEDEFIDISKKLNRNRNVYSVIRERKSGIKHATRSDDIVALNNVVIDIDPLRGKNMTSTDIELVRAIEVSQLIGQWFREHGFQKPITAVSGNGVHLYFSLPYYEIDDSNRNIVQEAIEFFESELRRMFKHDLEKYNCRIDRMYDLPRIAKIIGSKALKVEETKDRPFRTSYFIDEDVSRREDSLLLKAILEKNIVGTHLHSVRKKLLSPVFLMQPIPYFGEELLGSWIVEPKIDGWRLEVVKNESEILFYGRRLEKNPNWTEPLSKFMLGDALSKVPSGTILDCELYSNFGRRLIPSLFSKNPKAKPIILIFDVIYYNGKFIGHMPLEERKMILERMPVKEPFKILEYKVLDDIEGNLREAISAGYEGIVIKELHSPYVVGRDSPFATLHWRKIKPGRFLWQSEDFK